jgi:hypothetical protein
VAKRVVATYQQLVRPAQTMAGGVQAVLELILQGSSEADLSRAAAGYARWCERNDRPEKHRRAVRNFFSATGEWEEFAHAAAAPVETQAERNARLAREGW